MKFYFTSNWVNADFNNTEIPVQIVKFKKSVNTKY